MKHTYFNFIKVIGLVFLFLECSSQSNEQIGDLVWSDEFNYEGLPDEKKWDFEEGFVRNNEPQYYTCLLYTSRCV